MHPNTVAMVTGGGPPAAYFSTEEAGKPEMFRRRAGRGTGQSLEAHGGLHVSSPCARRSNQRPSGI